MRKAPGSIADNHRIVNCHARGRYTIAQFNVDVSDRPLVRVTGKVKGQGAGAIDSKVHITSEDKGAMGAFLFVCLVGMIQRHTH